MSVLIALLAIATLVSQSAMDVFASLLVLGFAWTFIQHRRRGTPSDGMLVTTGVEPFLGAWILAGVASCAVNMLPLPAWQPLIAFKWILVFYVLVSAYEDTVETTRALRPLLFAYMFCCAYAIAIWLAGYDPIQPENDFSPWSGGIRTGGFLTSPMTFAHVYGLHLCFWLGLLLTGLHWKTKSRPWLFAACALGSLAVLLSFTRGAWLGVAGAFVFMTFLRSVRLGAVVSVIGALIVAILLQWPMFAERAGNVSSHGDERTTIWRAHWQIFTENPVFGVGPEQTQARVLKLYESWGAPKTTQSGHAHNQYLHWLASTGVVGLAAALAFFGFMWLLNLRLYLRLKDRAQGTLEEGIALGLLGAQTMWLIGALTESSFEHSKLKYVLVLIWALVIRKSISHKVIR